MKLYLTPIFVVICTTILVSANKTPKPKKHHNTTDSTDAADEKIALAANDVYPQYEYPSYVYLSLKDLKIINEKVAKFQRWEECFLSPGSMKGCTGDPEGVSKMIIDKVIETRKKIPKQQLDRMSLIKQKHVIKKKKKHDNSYRTGNNTVREERIINAKDIYPKFDLSDSLKLTLSNIRDINEALIDYNGNKSCYLSPGGAMTGCKGDNIEVSKKIIEKIALAPDDALRRSD